MNLIRLMAMVLLLQALGITFLAAAEPDRRTCQRLARTYFKMPLRQTITEFTSHTLPEQYAIYICGNQYMHPPALHLAAPFASEGASAAALLHTKLAVASDDLTIRDIVRVFAEMKRLHSYDVASDRELMSLMERKSKAVSSAYWRNYVASAISDIEKP